MLMLMEELTLMAIDGLTKGLTAALSSYIFWIGLFVVLAVSLAVWWLSAQSASEFFTLRNIITFYGLIDHMRGAA